MLLKFYVTIILFGFSSTLIQNNNILVLIENVSIKDTHSIFLNFLKDRGYQLTFKYADDASLNLKQFGEYIYHHVVILSPSVREFGGHLDVKQLSKFVDDGGNVLVTGSSELGEAIRDFGIECGIEFDDERTSVIDHINYDATDNGKHTLIILGSENVVKLPVITGNVTNPLLYRGVGMSSDPENPLIVDILHAPKTSYSYLLEKAIKSYPNSVGTNTQLISGLQARNGARVLFVGSLDFFSDSFFLHKPIIAATGKTINLSGNQALAESIARWVLKETGVLRISSINHHKVGLKESQREYTIQDEVIYSIDIEIKNSNGDWQPYVADDVQLELVRIDPFIRQTLPHKGNKYQILLKLPDVYGVFKFVVDYNRVGYTHLFSSTQVSVRPFKHTQYERFIMSAYPYYASAISMMGGVLLFSFVFLYLKEDKEKSE